MAILESSEAPVRSSAASEEGRDSTSEPTELLIKRLDGHFAVREVRDEQDVRIYLETSDRRLAGAGLTLWVDRAARRLVVEHDDGRRVEQSPVATRWPARLDALPDGPVRRVIKKVVGIRALLAYAELSVSTASYAVLNGDGKTVARVHRSRGRLANPPQPLLDRVSVERLRGYGREAARVEKRLGLTATSAADDPWRAVLRQIAVPGQPPPPSADLTSGQRADVAVAGVLLDALSEMEAALDGIRRDLDIEYLHAFRVAVRRSRSVLKLLGDVLPDRLAEHASREFRWLGQVTTPARDLDVYVGELPQLARDLVRPDDLDTFAQHVLTKRTTAYRVLNRDLRSTRFTALCRDWRTGLEGVLAQPEGSPLTAAQLADQRLHRTFRKAARRARAIRPASPSEEIHDLRKACKELRYLLEMFRPLCDPAAYQAVVADFKALQDVLGDFQDGEVQAAALRESAEEMMQARSAGAGTLLSMGELAAQFDERQRTARARLFDRHLTHLGRSVARHIDRVVATRGAR